MTAHQPDLSTEEIGRIVNFLGYGRPSAPVWFMGIEEGLGNMNSQDIYENLKARANVLSRKFVNEILSGLVSGHDFPPRRMPYMAQKQMGFSP